MNTHIKPYLARAAASPAFDWFVRLLERRDVRRPGLLRVLTYHRVDHLNARPGLDSALISATPEAFREQMEFVAANFRVLSLAELLESQRAGRRLPPRCLLITFDDGYCDFAEHAWPILKRYNLPVTLFVPTGFPDNPQRTFWWDQIHAAIQNYAGSEFRDASVGHLPLAGPTDRIRAVKRLKRFVKTLPHERAMEWVERFCDQLNAAKAEHAVLGWDELRELSREGVTLAAHTRTHPILTQVGLREACREAAASRDDLQREIGATPPAFAYPSGVYNQHLVPLLKSEGFELAFTTISGINDLRVADPLQLRRFNITRQVTPIVLRAKMLSRTVALNRWQPIGAS